jgi:hypothetical protein
MRRRGLAVCLALLALPPVLGTTGCEGEAPHDREEATTKAAQIQRQTSQRFTSRRYGYSVEVPADWLTPDRFAEETEGEWSGDLVPLDRGVDTFSDAQVQTRVFAAARPVERGTTVRMWAATVDEGIPSPCGEPETRDGRELGGARALALSYHCSDGYYVLIAAALDEGRGFAIGWASPEGFERRDRARFKQILDSLAFGKK